MLEKVPGAYNNGVITITAPLTGKEIVVAAGAWQPSSDTFTSTGGSYSLGYILNKYNVFVRGDYTGNHVVGPVISGGNVSVSLGGSTTGTPAIHDVPSYCGETAPAQIITNMRSFIMETKTPFLFPL